MENENNWVVYAHIVPKELSGYECNKYYIGISSDVKNRWKRNGAGYKSQLVYNAISKYGWDNMHHIILNENLSKEKACKLEQRYIEMFRSNLREYGYNLTAGGEGGNKHGENIARYDWDGNLIDVFPSPKKAGEALQLESYSTISLCARQKRKQAHGYIWRYFDEKPLEKIEPFINDCWQPVLQYDMQGNFIREWRNIREANISLGANQRGSIANACAFRKRTHSAYGYQWRYKGSDIPVIDISNNYDYNTEKTIFCYTLDGCFYKEYENVDAVFKEFDVVNKNGIKTKQLTNKCSENGLWNGHLWSFIKTDSLFPQYIREMKKDFKPVVQFDLNNVVVGVYISISDAQKIVNPNAKYRDVSITKCCKNGNTYKGYRWRFIQDVQESEISDSFLLQKFKLINERLKQLKNKEV